MSLSLSLDQRKALVRHYLENAWNTSFDEKGNPLADTCDTEDGHQHIPACSETLDSPASAHLGAQYLDVSLPEIRKMMRKAFPDLYFTIIDVIVEEEKAAIRWLMQGTDLGGYEEHAPTGRSMQLTGITLLYMQGSAIVEEWNEADIAGLLRQLGYISILQPPKITMRRPGHSRPGRL
jgi:predicted ester cyclase